MWFKNKTKNMEISIGKMNLFDRRGPLNNLIASKPYQLTFGWDQKKTYTVAFYMADSSRFLPYVTKIFRAILQSVDPSF